uniref:Uncharacterized protein n=1 Tax=Sarcophilus harrisii TaxID=9305 RepID=A0A7N4PDM0_SARHA
VVCVNILDDDDDLRSFSNAEKSGKFQVPIRPCSKIVGQCITVMMKHNYIGDKRKIK